LELVNLCQLISNVQLIMGIKDMISWKLANDGSYSTASAYTMQFEGTILSPMQPAI
jgi:hypothetical protein